MFLKRGANFQIRTLFKNGTGRREDITARALSVDSNEYQFLQQSNVPTLHFQKSLPRLPLPELGKTCERYLTAVKPILTETEYNSTEKLVKNFKENEGKELHEELRKQDIFNSHTSYISEPWFDMYLSDRTPIPINYNPCLVFNKSKHSDNDNQVIKTSNLLISSLRFLKSLRKNILEPEVYHLNPKKSDTSLFRNVTRFLPSSVSWYGAYLFKAFPLDMSQYPNLFNSTRIPKLNRDVLQRDESGKHILVLRQGHFFIFDVFDKNGNILPPEDIFTCLKYIAEKDLKPQENSFGYLTTENRNVWARAREYILSKSEENVKSFSLIDSSLFAICLDDVALGSDYVTIIRNFLHGNGMNRWFDKSFSLLVSKDGNASLNFEHSWGDGVAVLRYMEDIYKDTNKNLFVHSNTQTSNIDVANTVRELTFTYDDKIIEDVRLAKAKFEKTCKSLNFHMGTSERFGKPECKAASLSPDAVIQLAIQTAYHRAFGNFVGSYESCSTAAFKHGRTETIRPCTHATSEFAMALNRKAKPEKSALIEMMRKCSSVHGRLTKEAAMGQGFDRHLFALKYFSSKIGRDVPHLFSHGAYKRINHNIISTSTLGSDAVLLGAFGPVVSDGLGIAYTIKNEVCGGAIASYEGQRNGAQFADAFESVLNDICEIIC